MFPPIWNHKKLKEDVQNLSKENAGLRNLLRAVVIRLSRIEGPGRSVLDIIQEITNELSSRHPRRARRLQFIFHAAGFYVEGENMQFTLQVGQSVNVIGSPVDINGSPSTAVLSGTSYSALDSTVFTVVPDPNTPNGAIITAIGAGSTTLTETATATEPDGVTTETVQGVATIVVTAVPPPPPPVAASLVFTFGTPFVPAAPAAASK